MMTAEYLFITLAVAVTGFRFVMLFKRTNSTNSTNGAASA